MYLIQANSFNDLYVLLARELANEGNFISPRHTETLELCNVTLGLHNPENNLITIKSRNYDEEYLKAEIAWYNSGDLHIADIQEHASIWSQIADKDGFVNSNYGHIMFRQMSNGFTQWDWCYEVLKKDIHTRQAVINFNQPKHKYMGNKDFVCTLSMQFLYRNNQLDCYVNMRSNDFIYGLAYDLPWFTLKHIDMAEQLGVRLGSYYHNATSMHVYERHYPMLYDIAKEYVTSDTSRDSHKE